MEGQIMMGRSTGARRVFVTAGKILGALALLALVVDGVLSVAWGTRWLEMQRTNTPSWYARIPAALQRLPDPALRALGGAQAAASVMGLLRLK